MATKFRQDMPPEGGFQPIQYERVMPKKLFSKAALLIGFLPIYAWSWYQMVQAKKFVRKVDIEKYDALVACEPFLQAERGRAFLKQLHKLRKDESELMKDVPGWQVGSFYGTPLYRTEPIPDALPNLTVSDYYAHRSEFEKENYCWPDKNLM